MKIRILLSILFLLSGCASTQHEKYGLAVERCFEIMRVNKIPDPSTRTPPSKDLNKFEYAYHLGHTGGFFGGCVEGIMNKKIKKITVEF